MYLAIITLPLLGSIVAGFFGRKIGVSGAQIITCTSVIVTTLLAIPAFFEVGLNNILVFINLFRWIDSESLNVLWGFNFDSLTVSMLIPVLVVSSLVHIYSIGYMSHDPHNQRFFSYLSLFTFMMIILVTANNFLLMFVGWEGVGVCSYLLVSFWFTRIAANQSSMSAFLTNRVGDCFLTIGMFAILWSFGNIDYSTVFSLAFFVNENIVTIIGICLLIGAMAKSSQVGLHVWLPMAMEGPTPVSALIHAATMVTAGVYLLMRTSPLIEYSSTVLILCLWLGAITTVFSSLIGFFQQDIKKVIAYSTMSWLALRNNIYIITNQTVCVDIIDSQITKAHDYLRRSSYNHINNSFFNSFFAMRQYLFELIDRIMSVKWKIIIICKLVGISEATRLMLISYFSNLLYFFTLMFTKHPLLFNNKLESSLLKVSKPKSDPFFEWLAGVIDGDGHFNSYKSGRSRFHLVMDIRDKKALYDIKHRLGGSIHIIASGNALRYKLTHKKGLIRLVNGVNGLLRNPIRMLQMNKLCAKYDIELIYPKPLTFNNGWLSGFIDSDGSLYFNEESGRIFISVSQNNKYLLEPLIDIYGGKLDILNPKVEVFKYIMYRKNQLFKLVDNYFDKYPLRTKKSSRVNLIKEFFEVHDYINSRDISKFNQWISFKDKWEKYND